MTFRSGTFGVSLIVTALTLLACSGGTKEGGQPTDVSLPTNAQGTPYAFAEFRDQFAERLESIGPNIGYVPQDVRQDLLGQCQKLTAYLDTRSIMALCDDISRAMQDNDPDLLKVTIRQFQALED